MAAKEQRKHEIDQKVAEELKKKEDFEKQTRTDYVNQ